MTKGLRFQLVLVPSLRHNPTIVREEIVSVDTCTSVSGILPSDARHRASSHACVTLALSTWFGRRARKPS
jgi:hypothetical protein